MRELSRFETNGNGAPNFTNDTLNRLVEALNPLPSNPQESYVYDPVGNRTNSNQNGLSAFNQPDQLLEVDCATWCVATPPTRIFTTHRLLPLSPLPLCLG